MGFGDIDALKRGPQIRLFEPAKLGVFDCLVVKPVEGAWPAFHMPGKNPVR